MVSKVSKVTITYINNIITIWLTDLHLVSKNTTNSGLARKYRCCLGITSGKYQYVLSSQLDMQLYTVLYIDYVINILCCCLCVDYKTQSMTKSDVRTFTFCVLKLGEYPISQNTDINRPGKSFRDKSNETWSIIKVLLFTLFQCYFIS